MPKPTFKDFPKDYVKKYEAVLPASERDFDFTPNHHRSRKMTEEQERLCWLLVIDSLRYMHSLRQLWPGGKHRFWGGVKREARRWVRYYWMSWMVEYLTLNETPSREEIQGQVE